MKNFTDMFIKSVFDECEDSLNWFLEDIEQEEIPQIKKEFLNYIEKWFDDYEKTKVEKEN